MDIRIRIGEGAGPMVPLLWDTVWQQATQTGDWAFAAATETGNRGGLAAKAGLRTAIILCLFTDKRCPDKHPLRHLAGDDPRGWWGDGVDVRADLGETEMGSLLWLLERSALTDEIITYARAFAVDALQPLVAQNACVRADAVAEADKGRNRLNLLARLYGRDGTQMHAEQFDILWGQV